MKNETIDKYLDQQGITLGPWEYQEDSDVYTHIVRSKNNRFLVQFGQDITGQAESAARIFANSRKSLRDWIMVACIEDNKSAIDEMNAGFYPVYRLATENIESSLDKPWSQVRAELEGFIDE